MTLDQYLTDQKIRETDFAAKINMSQAQVNRIRRGESWPARETMELIRKHTDGAVTPDDFLPPYEPGEEATAGAAA